MGGHCCFEASRSSAENEDEEPKLAEICESLCSYERLSSARGNDGAGTPKSKDVRVSANLNSQ